MTKEIYSFVLASPIERIRGGNVLIQLTVTWKIQDGDTSSLVAVPGIAFIPDHHVGNTQNLNIYIQEALQQSEQNLQSIGVLQSSTQQNNEVLKYLLTKKKEELVEPLLRNNKDLELDSPATDSHQRQLNTFCDTLGLARISLEVCTILEASAMIYELKQATKNIIKVGD